MSEERNTRREILKKVLTLGPLAALAGAFGGNGPKPAQAATYNEDVRINGNLAVMPGASPAGPGNVGIGTTGNFGFPGSKLYIDEGTDLYAAVLSSDTNGVLVLRNSNTAYTDSFFILHATGQSWGSYIQFKTTAYIKSDILFGTRTAGAVMAIIDAGNVGIGTTSPVAKLDVAGDIRLTGSVLPVGGGVFEGKARRSYYDT